MPVLAHACLQPGEQILLILFNGKPLKLFRDHGKVANHLENNLLKAKETLQQLKDKRKYYTLLKLNICDENFVLNTY